VISLATNPDVEMAAPAFSGRSAPARDGVWGLSASDLHERFWASKRVQVVRLGCGAFSFVPGRTVVHLGLTFYAEYRRDP